MTEQEISKLYFSKEGEMRLLLLRLEVDDELERLHEALQNGDEEKAELSRQKLAEMSKQLLMLEW